MPTATTNSYAGAPQLRLELRDDVAPLVLLVTVLAGLDPLLHQGRHLARLLAVLESAVDGAAAPADGAHGAHDGGGAGAEDLEQAALLRRVPQLAHGEAALRDHPPPRD